MTAAVAGVSGRTRGSPLFRVFSTERDPSLGPVDVSPLQRAEFALPPAAEVREAREILKPGGEVLGDGLKVGGLEEALAGVAFGEELDHRHRAQPILLDAEPERATERRKLSVHGGWRRVLGKSNLLVGFDAVRSDVASPLAVEHGAQRRESRGQRVDRSATVELVVGHEAVQEVAEKHAVLARTDKPAAAHLLEPTLQKPVRQ